MLDAVGVVQLGDNVFHVLCSLKMLEITSVSEETPCAAHQASVAANGRLYVHGGVNSHGNNDPDRRLWLFDPNTAHWVVLNENGPPLSHHAAFVSDDRYLNFVGGWTGKARSAEIAVFDTRQESWLPSALVSGFPVGGGRYKLRRVPTA